MNKAIFLTFPDIDKSSIYSWQNVLDCAEVDVSDLVTTLSNDQLVDSLIAENGCNAQLLSDDNLLGHGKQIGSPDGLRTESMAFRLNASGG